MDSLSRKLYRLVETAAGEKSAQSSWTRTTELLVAGITVPGLVVLVVWLGGALGLSLMWSQVVATILGLGLASLAMQRSTVCLTSRKSDGILCTLPTHLAQDVLNSYGIADSREWCGLMVNLTSDELEFLSELVGEYLEENDDLNHREFGFAKALLEKIEEGMG